MFTVKVTYQDMLRLIASYEDDLESCEKLLSADNGDRYPRLRAAAENARTNMAFWQAQFDAYGQDARDKLSAARQAA